VLDAQGKNLLLVFRVGTVGEAVLPPAGVPLPGVLDRYVGALHPLTLVHGT
jgi:hypothetical protein